MMSKDTKRRSVEVVLASLTLKDKNSLSFKTNHFYWTVADFLKKLEDKDLPKSPAAYQKRKTDILDYRRLVKEFNDNKENNMEHLMLQILTYHRNGKYGKIFSYIFYHSYDD